MLNRKVLLMASLSVVTGLLCSPVFAAGGSEGMSRLEQGKAIAFNRFKGNCLACHYVEGGELTGNYGPPLIAMKIRFPDRDVLREQIWDAAVKNPDTRMPPFGRNRILTEEEIDLVTDYIQSL
ncbi:MAG: sulfur oxidation c-type cytochrome SoxX [Xanthomonadales bacterium]|nr:sulfur oxidation c-type cytochrome SoxX [Xanthomonadales bacterium]